jgi:hypothetical protein
MDPGAKPVLNLVNLATNGLSAAGSHARAHPAPCLLGLDKSVFDRALLVATLDPPPPAHRTVGIKEDREKKVIPNDRTKIKSEPILESNLDLEIEVAQILAPHAKNYSPIYTPHTVTVADLLPPPPEPG